MVGQINNVERLFALFDSATELKLLHHVAIIRAVVFDLAHQNLEDV